ncbi:MAG: hypothetical protein ACKVS8_03965 [Phycisphaerales bacterium]
MPVDERWLRDRVKGGKIAHDAPCAKCGYNLIGLKRTGICPECGTPIRGFARAGRGGSTILLLPASLLWALALAAFAMFVGCVLMSLSWPFMPAARHGALRFWTANVVFAGAATGGACWFAGVLMLCLYKPAELEEQARVNWPRLLLNGWAIATQALWFVAAALVFALARLPAAAPFAREASFACGIVAILGLVPTMLVLVRTLQSVNDDKLHERLLVLAWTLPPVFILQTVGLTGRLPPVLAVVVLLMSLASIGLVGWLMAALGQMAGMFRWSVRNQRDAENAAQRLLLRTDERFKLPQDGEPISNPIPKHTASPQVFGGQ